ncbi:MAG: haloacid dehalogenase [Arachnia propionica]|nr:MAG: haloacid dehalogenase [Arachnia propionica]
MNWDAAGGYLFDLDGVITPTAEVHMRAWADMFNQYLASLPGQPPYTEQDYFAFVDGKPRYDGVRDFLHSRGITLPEGEPSDSPQAETVCGLGNRKNQVFNDVVASEGVQAYLGSVALIEHLAGRGAGLAVVSSSANAQAILQAAGLSEFFPVIVDGLKAKAEGLPGKPAPDTFLAAAAELGVAPGDAVVVEDALAGVNAGAAGGFGLVVGVDRGVGAAELRAAGADVVVADLAELLED